MASSYQNIVIIGPAYPLRGGLRSFNERLAREFMSHGSTVSIYSFALQYPGFLFPGTTQYTTEPAPAGLDIHNRINSVNPFNWLSVGRELKKVRPDLVVVRYWLPFMGPCLGTILRIIKKNRHTRIVCIADNILPHEKRFGDRWFTRYFIKPADAFITMSEKVMQDLRLFTKDKPARQVVHPLYDNFGEIISQEEARKQLHIETGDRIVLFFGFIRKYKGLDILLEAMKLLKEVPLQEVRQDENLPQLTHIKLLVAGEFYEDKKLYDDLISRLDIQDSLILHTDFIPDAEVRNYLCAADVLVQPYRSATQSGVTPLAYHFELPMIVTNVGSLPSLITDGRSGLVAEPNAPSIAERINVYFEKGREYFLPGLREEKKRFSWTKLTETILEVANSK